MKKYEYQVIPFTGTEDDTHNAIVEELNRKFSCWEVVAIIPRLCGFSVFMKREIPETEISPTAQTHERNKLTAIQLILDWNATGDNKVAAIRKVLL